MVLETEAESHAVRDSEQILNKMSPGTALSINNVLKAAEARVFSATEILAPADPLTMIGGTISGRPTVTFTQDFGLPCSKEITNVIQEPKITPGSAETSTTTRKTMGKEVPLNTKKEVHCH